MAKKSLPSPELLRKLLDYDPETGVLTWKERPRDFFESDRNWRWWNTRFSGASALSAIEGGGYKSGRIFGRPTKAHRVAWAIMNGSWPTGEIDHVNGDKTDNRISNLIMHLT